MWLCLYKIWTRNISTLFTATFSHSRIHRTMVTFGTSIIFHFTSFHAPSQHSHFYFTLWLLLEITFALTQYVSLVWKRNHMFIDHHSTAPYSTLNPPMLKQFMGPNTVQYIHFQTCFAEHVSILLGVQSKSCFVEDCSTWTDPNTGLSSLSPQSRSGFSSWQEHLKHRWDVVLDRRIRNQKELRGPKFWHC